MILLFSVYQSPCMFCFPQNLKLEGTEDLSDVLVRQGDWVHCGEVRRPVTYSAAGTAPVWVEDDAMGSYPGCSQLPACLFICCPFLLSVTVWVPAPWSSVLDWLNFTALWWPSRRGEGRAGEGTVLDRENLYPFFVSVDSFSLLSWSVVFQTLLL